MFRVVPEKSSWGRALMLLAAFALLVLAMTGPAHELCIGADGHLSIEPGHTQCPAGLATDGATGTSVTAAADACSDVSLRIDLPRDTGTSAKLPAPQPTTECMLAPAFHFAVAAVRDLARALATGPRRPRTPAALRTVVLRC